jgi:CheY-like chemotaxis protein
MLDDLLDVMRLSRGTFDLRREPLELGQLVRDSVEDHRAMFAEARLALELHEAGDAVWVEGDPTRLSQVCGNLLLNALKFTNPGGHVVVSVDRVGDRATVHVHDDGIGIAGDVLAAMFEPFVQAEASLDRARGGLGLGLSLAKTLVELHGGTIRADSAGVGKGADFVVTLPVCAEPSRAGREPSHDERSRRVLVIEDNQDTAETLREVLESEGHEVHVAFDGLRGVEAADRVHPDVILCDIGLPGIDGYEVARRVRASGEAGVLVAVTGYASPDDVRRAADAGFHHHLAKPADLETLSRIVSAARRVGSGSHAP